MARQAKTKTKNPVKYCYAISLGKTKTKNLVRAKINAAPFLYGLVTILQ